MKNIVYRLTLIISLFVAPLALSAKSPEQAYLEQYRGSTNLPVPVKIVAPDVENEFAGQTVHVEFTLDAAGVPTNITTTEAVPAKLAGELTAAVSKWRFQPLATKEQTKPAHIILPVTIVDGQS